VTRNPFGSVIEAQNEEDLYFAWGYSKCPGQDVSNGNVLPDRTGQALRILGESALKKICFCAPWDSTRSRGGRRRELSPGQKLLQRYVDGVNDHLETQKIPLYMKLLGLKKERWTLADPFAVGMMLNWSLAYNMKHELLYYKIAKKIGKREMQGLLNFIPNDSPTIVEGKTGVLRRKRQRLSRISGSS
jgi:acyl-homoserine lactone acylase PvdQ